MQTKIVQKEISFVATPPSPLCHFLSGQCPVTLTRVATQGHNCDHPPGAFLVPLALLWPTLHTPVLLSVPCSGTCHSMLSFVVSPSVLSATSRSLSQLPGWMTGELLVSGSFVLEL